MTTTADDLSAFRATAQDYLKDASSPERVRLAMESDDILDPSFNTSMAEMGWFGIEVPSALDGSDGGFAELAVVLEVMGANATVSPFVATSVLCIGALLHSTSSRPAQRWLPALATGESLGTAALGEVFGGGIALTATRNGSGYSLAGVTRYVLDARSADIIVVIADEADGTRVAIALEMDVAGLSVSPMRLTDATRHMDQVTLDDVQANDADVLARGADAEQLISVLVNRASVAVALDSVGLCTRLIAMTTAYAKQREQFGRAIGSFQAVKHQLADMLVQTEAAQVLTADAVSFIAQPRGAADVAASMAKEYAVVVGSEVAGASLQLHGGIGYTWEHDLHIYLKRAKLNLALFGDVHWHRLRIADHVLATGDVYEASLPLP